MVKQNNLNLSNLQTRNKMLANRIGKYSHPKGSCAPFRTRSQPLHPGTHEEFSKAQSSYWSLYGGNSQKRGKARVGVVYASISIGISREHVHFDKSPTGYSAIPSQPAENHRYDPFSSTNRWENEDVRGDLGLPLVIHCIMQSLPNWWYSFSSFPSIYRDTWSIS